MKRHPLTWFAIATALSFSLVSACSGNSPQNSQPIAETPATTEAAPTKTTEATPDTPDTSETESTEIVVFSEDGLAIRGADPVAYFTQGNYVIGQADYAYEWGGVTWQFASIENRDAFAANPEQYAPQYGGFCAWAVSQGYTAPIDPNAWKIVDGKLYLNYNQDVQKNWEKDIPGNIAKANANWPQVLTQ